MLEFLQQATAFVLALLSLVGAPLSVIGVHNNAAAVGVAYQGLAEPVMSGLYNGMSPAFSSHAGQRQMWLSGKPTQSAPAGHIYTSFYQPESGWNQPVSVFQIQGAKVADPAVIVDPVSGYLKMYYSIISDADALSSTTVRLKNRIGQAHSTNGVEWIDEGIVIDQNNGLDERGGWAPSAIVVGSEVWLYYSTNYPGKIQVYRTRFTLEGRQIGTDPIYTVDVNGQKTVEGFNVEVFLSRSVGKYVMFLNKDFTGIVRYVSDDGVRWSVLSDEQNPVIQAASSSIVAAPAVEVTTDGDGRETYGVFFVGGPISKGLFEGVYQAASVFESGTRMLFLDPKAKDYETWASAGSASSESNSGSGSGGGGLGGLVAVGALGIAAIVGLSFLSTTATVAETAVNTATGGSFGGRIIAIMPCASALGPSVWVTLLPAGPLLPPYMYIWTPATLTSVVPPIPSLPPRNIGQQLLGRFDIPYACVVPFPPFVFYGLRMQIMGASPVA